MNSNKKVCECELCGIEKECSLVGHDNGEPLYACSDCIKKELSKAMKMLKQDEDC